MDSLISPHTDNLKKSWVMGLIIECPIKKNGEECPAKWARELPFSCRLELVDKMDDDQLTRIIDYHKECMQLKIPSGKEN